MADKPTLSPQDLAELKAIHTQVSSLPEDHPDKKLAADTYQEMLDKISETHNVEPGIEGGSFNILATPLRAAGKIMDYGKGLTRTAIGEAALASQGKSDVGEGAKERILRAALPFGQPALGTGEYRHLTGAELSPAAENAAILPQNRFWNPTVGGAINYAGDTAADPTLLAGPIEAGGRALTGLQNAGEQKAPLLAKDAAAQLREALDAAKNTPLYEKTINYVKSLVANPSQTIGESLYRNRLSDADKAAAAVGAPPLSDALMRNKASGWTSAGIRQDVENLLARKNAEVDAAISSRPDLNIPANKLTTPWDTASLRPELTSPVAGESYETAQGMMQDKMDRALAKRAELLREDYGVPPPQAPAPRRFMVLPGEAPFPLKAPPMVAPNELEGDIANAAQNFSTNEVNEMRKGWQREYAGKQGYKQPTIYDTRNATQTKALADSESKALGDLENRSAQNAGNVLLDTLDTANPGAGGSLFQANKDMSSAMAGAPFIDAEFQGLSATPSSRMKNAWKPGNKYANALLEALSGVKDTAQTGASHFLRSGLNQYGIAPAIDSAYVESQGPSKRNNFWFSPSVDQSKEGQ